MRQNLSNAPSDKAFKDAERHLRGFQSRPPKKLEEIEFTLPKIWYPVGDMQATVYHSDKDDPATRPSSLRANDPEGVQGVMKLFEHLHDVDVILYCGAPDTHDLLVDVKNLRQRQPSVVWFLASLDHLRFKDNNGDLMKVLPGPKGGQIWGSPDTHTLYVLPRNVRTATPADCFAIRGGRMGVTPMGIEY